MTDNLSLLLGSDFDTVEGRGTFPHSIFILQWVGTGSGISLHKFIPCYFIPFYRVILRQDWYLITTVHPVVLFPKHFIALYVLEGLEE